MLVIMTMLLELFMLRVRMLTGDKCFPRLLQLASIGLIWTVTA